MVEDWNMKKWEDRVAERLLKYHGETWHTSRGKLIRDVVYAVDTGLVTTVAFLAGLSWSFEGHFEILLAGLAEVTAGMVAIFFGAYISTKAQREFFENQIEREVQEIEKMPEKETAEIREIFAEWGFSGEELDIAVRRITADKELWLKFMIQEEIGVVPGTFDQPIIVGLLSAGSFVLGALPVLSPFAFSLAVPTALLIAAVVVLVFLFIMGTLKTRLTGVSWLKSGLETMSLGALSTGVGYTLGRLAAEIFGH